MRLASLFSDCNLVLRAIQWDVKDKFFYADSNLRCLLFVQELCNNWKMYNQVTYPQNVFITRNYLGFFQHNMDTLVDCKLSILNLNVFNRGGFYETQGCRTPLVNIYVHLEGSAP